MEKEVIQIIREKGPLTGNELLTATGGDGLALWRSCRASPEIRVRRVGARYLRLDRRVKGFARLSPSILREFLTYSVVGLARDPAPVEEKARQVLGHIGEVSRFKLELAYRTVSGLASQLDTEIPLEEQACFIIAGDIVYNMAHDVPRPERSTGKPVNGSDMDIVVIAAEDCPESLIKRLDDAIFQEKCRLLMAPHLREEIDYVVKDLARIREQLCFDSFRRMVACKILQEGALLYGSEDLFQRVKGMLRESGVMERLKELETRAGRFRREGEAYLLATDPEKIASLGLDLFYPSEESEEFE